MAVIGAAEAHFERWIVQSDQADPRARDQEMDIGPLIIHIRHPVGGVGHRGQQQHPAGPVVEVAGQRRRHHGVVGAVDQLVGDRGGGALGQRILGQLGPREQHAGQRRDLAGVFLGVVAAPFGHEAGGVDLAVAEEGDLGAQDVAQLLGPRGAGDVADQHRARHRAVGAHDGSHADLGDPVLQRPDVGDRLPLERGRHRRISAAVGLGVLGVRVEVAGQHLALAIDDGDDGGLGLRLGQLLVDLVALVEGALPARLHRLGG